MKDNRNKIVFALLALFGAIGVFGEAAKLHNSLVHSYPFKMMGMPPAEFYSFVGEIGYYLAVAFGLASIMLAIKLPRFLISALPVVVCPLVYWLVFELAHVIEGFSRDQMMERNFEGYTGNTARYEFGYEVLTLLLAGILVGGVIGFTIDKLSAIRKTRLA